jgi:hypothetical protein
MSLTHCDAEIRQLERNIDGPQTLHPQLHASGVYCKVTYMSMIQSRLTSRKDGSQLLRGVLPAVGLRPSSRILSLRWQYSTMSSMCLSDGTQVWL